MNAPLVGFSQPLAITMWDFSWLEHRWPGAGYEDWIKETCELGTLTASATRRWAAVATSNFCGSQFRGMWRNIAWHQRLKQAIKAARLPADFAQTKL